MEISKQFPSHMDDYGYIFSQKSFVWVLSFYFSNGEILSQKNNVGNLPFNTY
jgi:hypothetical protein